MKRGLLHVIVLSVVAFGAIQASAFSRSTYLDLMEQAVGAYSDAQIRQYLENVRKKGLREHGFGRLAANMGILIAKGRLTEKRALFRELMDEYCRQVPDAKRRRGGGVGNNFSVKEVVACIVEVEKAKLFPKEVTDAWRRQIGLIVAKDAYAYVYPFTKEGGLDEAHNWAIFSAASEQARIAFGMGGDPSFVEDHIASQMRFFDENGMYRDPHEPLVYDFVTRLQFMVALHYGYAGPQRAKLEDLFMRSAEPTLLMQSVTGEVPYGGRSNQFLHNETFYAAVCEWYATWFKKHGDQKKAQVFRAPDVPSIKSRATGFFRLEELGEPKRWWVIDPNGFATFMRGIDHIRYEGHQCEALKRHLHHEANKKLFPNRRDWETDVLAKMGTWGFNMLGAGCDTNLMYRGLAHTRFLSVGESLCVQKPKDFWICPYERKPCSAFPNVFHPDFPAWCDARARARCAPNKDDPWLFGYFLDNELAWWGRGAGDTGLFEAVMKLDASHTAKTALREFLQSRGVAGEPSRDDKRAFLRLAAERYFSAATAAIRRHDPNHLILGARFAGLQGADPIVWEVTGKYCDIVTFNCYPWADLDRNEMRVNSEPTAKTVAQAFTERSALVGKPVLITEWSFPALDSGLPCLRGAGQRFYTQTERTQATALFAKTMLSLPCVIGYDYFMWVDQPARGISKAFPEDSNYGLLAESGKPYPEITRMFTALHGDIGKWRLSPLPPVKADVPVWRGVTEQGARAAMPAGGEISFARTADGGYRVSNTAGLVLEGKIGGRNLLASVKLGEHDHGSHSLLLHLQLSPTKEAWRKVARVTSAEFERRDAYGVLTLTGECTHETGSYRLTQEIVLTGSSPYYLSSLKTVENVGEGDLDVKGVFFLQFPVGDVVAKSPHCVPNLWKRPMKDAWIHPNTGVWTGGATRAPAVRSFRYFTFGDGSRHPDAVFAPRERLVLKPGARYDAGGDMWMYALGGTGGAAGWKRTSAEVLSRTGGERWFEDMVAMPDGVKLYTYGSVPAPGVKCPIIVQRNPYVKERRTDFVDFMAKQRATLARGYARVTQHCRGAGMSEGVRVPYDDERADGLALLEYVRKLPWYNGEIYLEGGSYLSSVHWTYLDTNPADVKGAFLAIQEVDRYNICYRNGFFKTGLHGGWYLREYYKTDHKLPRNGKTVKFSDFPLIDFSTRYWGRPEPSLDNVIRHPRRDDPFWRSDQPGSGFDARYALLKSTMPVLMHIGFYDIFTEGLFDMWREIPESRRANCALIANAYDHGGRLSKALAGTKGEFKGGSRRAAGVEPLDWFDAIRAAAREGRPFTGAPGAAVNTTRYFALWENAWHVEPELLDGPRKVAFTLGDTDRAYTYDPKRPLPNFPGSGGICFGGMQIQPKPDFRDDVVSFVLPPITERLDVRGRMTADLTVESDCADTCFYIRVSVDKGDGKWYLLRDDINSLSTAAREGRLVRSGSRATISYRFPDHAFRLEPGDRLRVDVASACSQFAPHTNVAGDQFAIREPKTAHNKVIASASRLMLPCASK